MHFQVEGILRGQRKGHLSCPHLLANHRHHYPCKQEFGRRDNTTSHVMFLNMQRENIQKKESLELETHLLAYEILFITPFPLGQSIKTKLVDGNPLSYDEQHLQQFDLLLFFECQMLVVRIIFTPSSEFEPKTSKTFNPQLKQVEQSNPRLVNQLAHPAGCIVQCTKLFDAWLLVPHGIQAG